MVKQKVLFVFGFVLILLCSAVFCDSADFSDDFSDVDYAGNGWNADLMFGKPNLDYIFPGRRMLSFRLPDYNTAVYMLNENTWAEDSAVEVSFENVFSNHGEFGIVCRAQEDGWYELRIYLSGPEAGSYAVYRYETALREEGKNPFVCLHPTMDHIYTRALKTGNYAQNTIKMLCEGDEIRIFINGKEHQPFRNSQLKAEEFQNGQSGFSVWTQRPFGDAEINVTSFRSIFEAE